MKKIQRCLLAFIVITIMLINTNISYAATPSDVEINNSLFEIVGDALEVEEERTSGQYVIYDYNNQDITSNFKSIAYPLYTSGKISALQQYCKNNIKKVVVMTEVQESITRSDLSKTVDERVVEILYDKNNKGLTCTVDYTARASITYDPNTYRISSATKPVIVKRRLTPSSTAYSVKTKLDYSEATIASNKLSADFYYEFTVYMTSDYGNIDFGKTHCSFSINVE